MISGMLKIGAAPKKLICIAIPAALANITGISERALNSNNNSSIARRIPEIGLPNTAVIPAAPAASKICDPLPRNDWPFDPEWSSGADSDRTRQVLEKHKLWIDTTLPLQDLLHHLGYAATA